MGKYPKSDIVHTISGENAVISRLKLMKTLSLLLAVAIVFNLLPFSILSVADEGDKGTESLSPFSAESPLDEPPDDELPGGGDNGNAVGTPDGSGVGDGTTGDINDGSGDGTDGNPDGSGSEVETGSGDHEGGVK